MIVSGLVLVGSILALGALYVLLPWALHVYRHYRWRYALRCPETGKLTSVQIDPGRAARSALFGDPALEVTDCARWPEKKDCDQDCMEEVADKGWALRAHRPGGWAPPEPPPIS